jgi:hypothetical protein
MAQNWELEHDTLFRKVLTPYGLAGSADSIDHVEPSQISVNGAKFPTSVSDVPTAMQNVVLTQLTDSKLSLSVDGTLGLVRIVHVEPFHFSARGDWEG